MPIYQVNNVLANKISNVVQQVLCYKSTYCIPYRSLDEREEEDFRAASAGRSEELENLSVEASLRET